MDTILNQKGKDVICIYVDDRTEGFYCCKSCKYDEDNDALDYTIVVSSTASDCAAGIAPYAGTAMAEAHVREKDV